VHGAGKGGQLALGGGVFGRSAFLRGAVDRGAAIG